METPSASHTSSMVLANDPGAVLLRRFMEVERADSVIAYVAREYKKLEYIYKKSLTQGGNRSRKVNNNVIAYVASGMAK